MATNHQLDVYLNIGIWVYYKYYNKEVMNDV